MPSGGWLPPLMLSVSCGPSIMSTTRINSPASKTAVSPTAFGIVMVIGLVSFYLGLVVVGTAYNRIAPYWLFGKQTVQEQSIHVTVAARHFLVFSNAPSVEVPRSKLGQLNYLSAVARFIIIPGLFFIFIYPTVRVLQSRNPSVAKQIMVFCRREDSLGKRIDAFYGRDN